MLTLQSGPVLTVSSIAVLVNLCPLSPHVQVIRTVARRLSAHSSRVVTTKGRPLLAIDPAHAI